MERPGYWSVPDNWQWVPIGEFAEIPADSDDATEAKLASPEGTIPFIKSGNLENTKVIHVSTWTTEKLLNKYKIQPLERGRILLDRARAETVGRVGTFKGKAVHNRGVHAIVPDQNMIDLDYLFYCLRASEINARIVEEVIVQRKTSIQKKHTLQIMIPVPPVAEQRRIVERIEILFHDVERAGVLLQQTRQDITNVARSLVEQHAALAANQDIQDHLAHMRDHATQSEQLLKAIEQKILSDALRGNLYRERA